MNVVPTAIPDVLLIEPLVRRDQRGFFLETWHSAGYAELGIEGPFVQDNHSRSVRGTLRGLHYQIEQPQGKLVQAITGAVYDVAVDLRRGSPSFRRWVGVELSELNHRQLWVPPGFAHGFYVLSEQADLVYKCTDFYAMEHERTVRWDDADLAIDWPLIGTAPPILSSKDAAGLSLQAAPVYP